MKSPGRETGQRTEEPRGCRGMGLAVRLGLRKSNIDMGSTSYKRTQCGLFAAVLCDHGLEISDFMLARHRVGFGP